MKSVLRVAVPAMLLMLGLSVLFPVLPFYVRDLGLSESEAGILFATYAAMSVWCSPLWGRFSERRGRKPAMVIGLTGFAVGFLLFAWGDRFLELFLARVIGGGLAAAALPAIFAYAGDVTRPHERSRAMGIVGAAIGLGIVTGPVFGGILAEHNLRAPFYCTAAIAMVGAIYVAVAVPEPESRRSELARTAFDELFADLRGILLFIFLISTARVGFESTIAFALADLIGAGSRQVGYLLGTIGVVGVAVQGGLIRPVVSRIGEYRTMVAGTVLLGIGLAGMGLADGFAEFCLSGAVLAVGYGLSTPTFTAIVSQLAENDQGRAQGMAQSAQSLGRVMGPLLFATVYEFHGRAATYFGAACLAMVGLAVAILAVDGQPAHRAHRVDMPS